MIDKLCKVIANEELAAGYYRLTLEKPFDSFQPGQFVMVRVPGQTETLLRRPFSLCQEESDRFEIVFKAVGPTTRVMAHLNKEDQLSVLGPLGKGVDWKGFSKIIGVAGGYGIAPMLGLGRHLRDAGIDYEVYYGARTEEDLLLLADFDEAGISVHVSTEDGSRGVKGLITEPLKKDQLSSQCPTLWFVCGPHGLLKATAGLAAEAGIPCSASMEEYMGCGIGVCLGCVVKTHEGRYIRSCVEGPVMDAGIVSW